MEGGAGSVHKSCCEADMVVGDSDIRIEEGVWVEGSGRSGADSVHRSLPYPTHSIYTHSRKFHQ